MLIKIFIAGDPGVGKTSLLNRFSGQNSFISAYIPSSEPDFIALESSPKSPSISLISSSSSTATSSRKISKSLNDTTVLQIWDCPDPCQQFSFMCESHVCVLVADWSRINRSISVLPNFIAEFKRANAQYNAVIEFILLVNKTDLMSDLTRSQIISAQNELDNFCQQYSIPFDNVISVSAATDSNLSEALEKMSSLAISIVNKRSQLTPPDELSNAFEQRRNERQSLMRARVEALKSKQQTQEKAIKDKPAEQIETELSNDAEYIKYHENAEEKLGQTDQTNVYSIIDTSNHNQIRIKSYDGTKRSKKSYHLTPMEQRTLSVQLLQKSENKRNFAASPHKSIDELKMNPIKNLSRKSPKNQLNKFSQNVSKTFKSTLIPKKSLQTESLKLTASINEKKSPYCESDFMSEYSDADENDFKVLQQTSQLVPFENNSSEESIYQQVENLLSECRKLPSYLQLSQSNYDNNELQKHCSKILRHEILQLLPNYNIDQISQTIRQFIKKF